MDPITLLVVLLVLAVVYLLVRGRPLTIGDAHSVVSLLLLVSMAVVVVLLILALT